VKTQFNVEMTCDHCVKSVEKVLENLQGVLQFEIHLESGEVTINSTCSSIELLDALRSTGKESNITGQGELGNAVCILENLNSKGVIRFIQISEDRILVEGYVNGLNPGIHGISVHEFGDLSRGSESVGGHFNPYKKNHGNPEDNEKHAGDLGNIMVNELGVGSLRLETNQLKVWDCIGRSLVVHEREDDGTHSDSGLGISYGIIARSAGIGENKKKICTCDDPNF